jgi:hypothetical protein
VILIIKGEEERRKRRKRIKRKQEGKVIKIKRRKRRKRIKRKQEEKNKYFTNFKIFIYNSSQLRM